MARPTKQLLACIPWAFGRIDDAKILIDPSDGAREQVYSRRQARSLPPS